MGSSTHAVAAAVPCGPVAFAGLAADLLSGGKAVRFRASGNSMQPLIRDGDVLLIGPVDASAVQVGDVILFHGEPNRVVVHRVTRVGATPEGRRFTVQGDARSQPDGDILGSQVYGRVLSIERGAASIDVRRPVMRILGWAAALRSRWGVGRGHQLRQVKGLARRLPVLDRFLA
jgi:signal peptidase I